MLNQIQKHLQFFDGSRPLVGAPTSKISTRASESTKLADHHLVPLRNITSSEADGEEAHDYKEADNDEIFTSLCRGAVRILYLEFDNTNQWWFEIVDIR